MSEVGHPTVTEVEVAAHTILLPRGTYCVFVSDVSAGVPAEQLPGLGVSAAPGEEGSAVEVARLAGEPWLRRRGDGVLVRVHATEVRLLLTSYNQARALGAKPPKIEVQRLDPSPAAEAASRPALQERPSLPPSLMVHVRNRGDQPGQLGEWVGEQGPELWVEGFTILPIPGVEEGELEYQAVLGKGWLSPWVGAGEFCGSRGMQLPILGVRLRLGAAAAERVRLRVSAAFADGTTYGPVDAGELCAREPLQPVAALRLEVSPVGVADAADGAAPPTPGSGAKRRTTARKR